MRQPRISRLLCAGLVLAHSACEAEASSENEDWVPVTRGDLSIEVDMTGAIRPSRPSQIKTPVIPDMWDFKIVRMAPEGAEVKEGAPVLFLDSTELDQMLIERQSERDRIRKELSQKDQNLDLARADANLKVEEAEAAARKAGLKADLPAAYTAEITMKLAKLDAAAADAELRMARQRREQQVKLGEAELVFLRERLLRAEGRLHETQYGISKLALRAPAGGMVIYKYNWRGEKKKVGDSCWNGETCLEIANFGDVVAKGLVEETESARVRIGQRAVVRLEAFPEMEWTGQVAGIRPNVFRQSARTPIKVIEIDVKLDKVDRARMRPHMHFRGRVAVDQVDAALMVPLATVFSRPGGPIAFRKTAGGHEIVPLRLGKRNRSHVEVVRGLREQDLVSRRDLQHEAPGS
jgi:multidrug resistance efflux pump